MENNKKETLKQIKKYLQNNTNNKVYAIVTKVNNTNTKRHIKYYTIKDGELLHISVFIANILGLKMSDKGIAVCGGGMDMIFNTLYYFNATVMQLENAPQNTRAYYNYLLDTDYSYIG